MNRKHSLDLLPIIFGIFLFLSLQGKHSTNFLISLETQEENQNPNKQVHTIKISLDSGASTSIIHRSALNSLHKIIRHYE